MLLQEGVPLKAACSWKRVACVPSPVAISRSLPVVLDLVSLSRGGRDLSPLGGVSCRNKSIPAHFSSAIMLVEVCRGQIWSISLPFFPCFLHPCRSPTVLCGRAHPWASCPFVTRLAAATSCLPIGPHTPFRVSQMRGDPLPCPCKEVAFPCKSWEVPEHWVHLRRATGTCWDLARFIPASAPPCAGNSQVFNYSPLWEAAEDTGDFGVSCLGTSAARSSCSP